MIYTLLLKLLKLILFQASASSGGRCSIESGIFAVRQDGEARISDICKPMTSKTDGKKAGELLQISAGWGNRVSIYYVIKGDIHGFCSSSCTYGI